MIQDYDKLEKIGFGYKLSLNRKGYPIDKRVFDTLNELISYISNKNSSAMPGLILAVVDDGENNGAYLVNKVVGIPTGNIEYEYVRLSTGDIKTITLDADPEVATLTDNVLTIKDMRTYWDDQSF
jgi:hypothetical protein